MADQLRDLPLQRQPEVEVASVVAAADVAEHVRDQLELLPTATAAERDRLRQELALLRHWLALAETGSSHYHAVVEELTRVAADAETMLTAAEAASPATVRA